VVTPRRRKTRARGCCRAAALSPPLKLEHAVRFAVDAGGGAGGGGRGGGAGGGRGGFGGKEDGGQLAAAERTPSPAITRSLLPREPQRWAWRRRLERIVRHRWFDWTVLFIIIVNCGFLAVDNPLHSPTSTIQRVLAVSDWVRWGVVSAPLLCATLQHSAVIDFHARGLRSWSCATTRRVACQDTPVANDVSDCRAAALCCLSLPRSSSRSSPLKCF
jgi:hypothetical protein